MANASILAAFERMWQHITAVLSNKSDTDHTHDNATKSDSGFMSAEDKIQLDNGGIPIVTTSGSYMAYKADIEGVSELTVGMKITIIPHITKPVQTGTSTLNINDLGAKGIMLPVGANQLTSDIDEEFIIEGVPVTLEYTGTLWRVISYSYADADKLQGIVLIENGGTSAVTVEDARTNLEVYSKTEVENCVKDCIENNRPIFNFYYKTDTNANYADTDNAESFEQLVTHLSGDEDKVVCKMIYPIVSGSTYSYSSLPAQVRRITNNDSSEVQMHIYAELFDRLFIIKITKAADGQFSYFYMDCNPYDNLKEQYNGNFVNSINIEKTLTDNETDSTDIEQYFTSTGYTSIVEITGVIANDSTKSYLPLSFYYKDTDYCCVQLLQNTLKVYHSTMYSGYTLRATIKYI